jgi:cell division protein FtsZ
MQGRVEITVLGTSDMGSRGVVARKPAPLRQRPITQRPEEPAPRQESAVTLAADANAMHGQKPMQDEFGFGEVESRGQFERTDRNLFDGQDLDVPTYLRKGIKIAV